MARSATCSLNRVMLSLWDEADCQSCLSSSPHVLQQRHRSAEFPLQALPPFDVEPVHGKLLQCLMHLEQRLKASRCGSQRARIMG
ncbi:hypothetical protein [Pseudomonas aeruginosa]|uniref:hypothetical protein n=1 Tax=Pseudomonas aeruginosa TaxID=287 RepID=UPI004046DCD0